MKKIINYSQHFIDQKDVKNVIKFCIANLYLKAKKHCHLRKI